MVAFSASLGVSLNAYPPTPCRPGTTTTARRIRGCSSGTRAVPSANRSASPSGRRPFGTGERSYSGCRSKSGLPDLLKFRLDKSPRRIDRRVGLRVSLAAAVLDRPLDMGDDLVPLHVGWIPQFVEKYVDLDQELTLGHLDFAFRFA